MTSKLIKLRKNLLSQADALEGEGQSYSAGLMRDAVTELEQQYPFLVKDARDDRIRELGNKLSEYESLVECLIDARDGLEDALDRLNRLTGEEGED